MVVFFLNLHHFPFGEVNRLQTFCFRTFTGYIRSTPCVVIEGETLCPPFNIRCRWFAGKFIVQSLSTINHFIFDTLFSLFFLWRYVKKSLPVLSLRVNSLSSFLPYIFNTLKPTLYKFFYISLLLF